MVLNTLHNLAQVCNDTILGAPTPKNLKDLGLTKALPALTPKPACICSLVMLVPGTMAIPVVNLRKMMLKLLNLHLCCKSTFANKKFRTTLIIHD